MIKGQFTFNKDKKDTDKYSLFDYFVALVFFVVIAFCYYKFFMYQPYDVMVGDNVKAYKENTLIGK